MIRQEKIMTHITEKKKIISDFIRQCNDYADGQIRKYQARLDSVEDMEALDTRDKNLSLEGLHRHSMSIPLRN